jgi:hypothetical protein
MTRRITVPDDHVAIILSAQLADELMALMKVIRQRCRKLNADPEHQEGYKDVAGDVLLALLEAKEA